MNDHFRVLALESSCDEFAGAVIEDGVEVLASVVASQVEIHSRYGGIVPEVASREHLRNLAAVLQGTLDAAGCGWDDLDAIAVTQGPGLGGSLLVGVNAAKAAAWARGLPLIPIHHIEGHLYANWLRPARASCGTIRRRRSRWSRWSSRADTRSSFSSATTAM